MNFELRFYESIGVRLCKVKSEQILQWENLIPQKHPPERNIYHRNFRHFDFSVSKAVITRQVQTYHEFCKLLREFDDLYTNKNPNFSKTSDSRQYNVPGNDNNRRPEYNQHFQKPTYRSNHVHVNRPPPPPQFRPNRRYNNEYRQTNNNRSTSRSGNISSHVSKPTHLEENDVTKARTAYLAVLHTIQVVEADIHNEPSTNEHYLR
ncbi:hypothetical protein Trydic_g7668 [Trypoxylus dichotomus]